MRVYLDGGSDNHRDTSNHILPSLVRSTNSCNKHEGTLVGLVHQQLEVGLDSETSRAMVHEVEGDLKPGTATGKHEVDSIAAFHAKSLSLRELLLDTSFQIYCTIHVLALASAVRWHNWHLFGACMALYAVRMFGITGGYHRLLSHRSYKTSRVGQFVLALLGSLALQKGPLWWCSHHRQHHRTADTVQDAHSPVQWGFWWSHFGWFLCSDKHAAPVLSAVPDLAQYPELRWLDRYHYVPPFMVMGLLYLAGSLPLVGWGFFVSTVLCWHATYCINSVAHLLGSRRYRCEFNTHCEARNNFWLAIATLGEGWHNNHHCYMRSSKHGFYFYEVDITYYILRLLSLLGLVWDLELPPLKQLESRRFNESSYQCRCESVQDDLSAIAKAPHS